MAKIASKLAKLHLHIENTGELGPVFEATRKRVREALKNHPELNSLLCVTVGYDGDNLEKNLKTANALFCWDIDRKDLSQRAPALRWIHVHGAGINHWKPLDQLPKNIVLTNSRGVHGQRATEYVMMAILALNNRLPEMTTNQRQKKWQQCFSSHLAGKTLLIIGVGNIGSGVARWAKSVSLHVLGIRRTGKPRRWVDEMHKPNALRKLLPKADFVLVSAPHTKQTNQIIGAKELNLLKQGAGLVNYSRANLMDYDALRKKLKQGKLSAVLDVFSPEPLPRNSPLWNTPNLIITPHCSSDDAEYYTPRTLELVFENMTRFIAGRPLKNRVSKELEY
ncbi:MAG: D-2-hydroxyacid dehydrogenase [Gammaproteobacteria bacterium]|nr:D-2-hydroxyacid dehydrogenase [Gammaproteobacteria bacterium]